MEKNFGVQGRYLIDFYYACNYLSAAGKALHNEEQKRKILVDEQKIRLKTGAWWCEDPQRLPKLTRPVLKKLTR